MRKAIVISSVLLFGTLISFAEEPEIRVEGAWMRAVPAAVSETAVYLTIINSGRTAYKLVGAKTPIAESVDPMITTKSGTGTTQRSGMEAVVSLDVPAAGRLVLEPGGNHLMVTGLKKHPAEGEKIDITIRLEPGDHEIRLEVPVSRRPIP
jgi:periplasmic copper chaperone A